MHRRRQMCLHDSPVSLLFLKSLGARPLGPPTDGNHDSRLIRAHASTRMERVLQDLLVLGLQEQSPVARRSNHPIGRFVLRHCSAVLHHLPLEEVAKFSSYDCSVCRSTSCTKVSVVPNGWHY